MFKERKACHIQHVFLSDNVWFIYNWEIWRLVCMVLWRTNEFFRWWCWHIQRDDWFWEKCFEDFKVLFKMFSTFWSIKHVLSGGLEPEYGLTDYVKAMSRPAWVWRDGQKINKLYSFSESAREEILDLFNDKNLTSMPNFENLNLLCTGQKLGIANYCGITKILPDLKTTFMLMNLATHPGLINEHLKTKLR